MRYVGSRPWAIIPGTLEAIVELLAVHEAGEQFSPEELEERIKDGPGRGTRAQVGGVAILPISGVITPRADLFSDVSGGTSLETFRSQLAEAMGDEDVKAIVLDVNSPGGSTELLEETAAEIRAARDVKPIIAVSNTMNASAAYHLSSQASELFVTPSGYAGSIGVYMAHEDLSEAQKKAGIKTTHVKAGAHKVDGNPFEPLSKEAREHLQSLVDAAHGVMVRDIAEGRRVSESDVRGERFGEGRVFDARRAVARGLADGVQTFDETVATVLVTGESGRAPAGVATLELAYSANASTASTSTFSDGVRRAVSALEAIVSDSERFPRLSRSKQEQLSELHGRLGEVLAEHGDELEEELSDEAGNAGAELELETEAAIAAASAMLALGGTRS
jgi:signal peptide peptidase SppA